MSDTPLKKRRATIFVTGPQSKTTIYPEADGEASNDVRNAEPKQTLQDLAIAHQRAHHGMIAANAATGVEILIQMLVQEVELVRHRIRERGEKMRNFFGRHISFSRIQRFLLRIFAKHSLQQRSLEFRDDKQVILNEVSASGAMWKTPQYTLNELSDVLLTDDLEDGIIQRRSEKWEYLPVRPQAEPADDSLCEFQKMNMPMSMVFEDEDDDRLSMPSTRTALTTEDQMNVIQNQLAMLSKQLMNLQKSSTNNFVTKERGSSRASSRKGGRMTKKPSIDVSSGSTSSETSEDEGKGASVCSPAHSQRKVSPILPTKVVSKTCELAPMAVAPPPPPPPPPPMNFNLENAFVENTPKVAKKQAVTKTLPASEVIVSNRPYLTDIANGRSMLKKTTRSPGGSPMGDCRRGKRHESSFEAALRDRFRGFHGDASYSEQEEIEEDDVNGIWDE